MSGVAGVFTSMLTSSAKVVQVITSSNTTEVRSQICLYHLLLSTFSLLPSPFPLPFRLHTVVSLTFLFPPFP